MTNAQPQITNINDSQEYVWAHSYEQKNANSFNIS